MREDRRYALVVAVFAAALYVAAVVAVFGLISLAIDRDPIDLADAGNLLGPSMCAAATLAVFGSLSRIGWRWPPQKQRVSTVPTLIVGAIAYVVYVVVGGILYSLGSTTSAGFVSFTLHIYASWFSISVGVFAVLVALSYELVLIGRFRQRGRPEWPWEHHDE